MSTDCSDVRLDVERPAVGGRMIARHEGRVVLVAGAIPGERVLARLERVERGVAYARVVEVVEASPDRRTAAADPACGGCVLSHVAYARQVELKREILVDAFRRIGKIPLDPAPTVVPSPERGYRLRARLHVSGRFVGFYREGTHEICDPAGTGQLLPASIEALEAVGRQLEAIGSASVRSIDLAESLAGDQRAIHLELKAGVASRGDYAALARVPGVTGVTCQAPPGDLVSLGGRPWVEDPVEALAGQAAVRLRGLAVRRRPHAFFQANRYLLPALVSRVAALAGRGPVVDLYAGVGVFALALAALGHDAVTAVEGDPVTGADLAQNARGTGGLVRAERLAVERYLARRDAIDGALVVDPPRTGLSRAALDGVVASQAPRIVYVSCDVATLARDVRRLVDAGYRLASAEAFDLFPNTAHVESVVSLIRTR